MQVGRNVGGGRKGDCVHVRRRSWELQCVTLSDNCNVPSSLLRQGGV